MVVALHRITSRKNNESLNGFIEISIEKLEDIILSMKKLGVKFVSLKDIEESISKGKAREPIVHFSFDDGYADNYYLGLPLFKKYSVPFSVFVVSEFVENPKPFVWWYIIEEIIKQQREVNLEKYNFHITAEMYGACEKQELFNRFQKFILEHLDKDREYIQEILDKLITRNQLPEMLSWKQIQEMYDSGLCEIGIHSATHPRMVDLDEKQKKEEIMLCGEAIYKNLKIRSACFSYPYGSNKDIGLKGSWKGIMESCGIRLALTTIPQELTTSSDMYFLPRIFLNDSSTDYTIKVRLDGSYQRQKSLNKWDT